VNGKCKTLQEGTKLAFLFESQIHFDFSNCKTETSKCFKCEREMFTL